MSGGLRWWEACEHPDGDLPDEVIEYWWEFRGARDTWREGKLDEWVERVLQFLEVAEQSSAEQREYIRGILFVAIQTGWRPPGDWAQFEGGCKRGDALRAQGQANRRDVERAFRALPEGYRRQPLAQRTIMKVVGVLDERGLNLKPETVKGHLKSIKKRDAPIPE